MRDAGCGRAPAAAAGSTLHGFLAEDSRITAIDHPDASTVPATPNGYAGTDVTGINDRGQILGIYEGRDRVYRPLRPRRNGAGSPSSRTPPGTSGDRLSYLAVDLNNRGEIVGFYVDEKGFTASGFMRTKRGRFISIEVPGSIATEPVKINDRGQVVGFYADAGGLHGFLWENGDFEAIDAPRAAATVLYGIDNRGRMVGAYFDPDGTKHGLLRGRSGDITTIDAPFGEAGTDVLGINERGQIVGAANGVTGGSRGFLLERGVFTLDGAPGATFTRAFEINDRGQIVGDYGTLPDGKAARSGGRLSEFRRRGLFPAPLDSSAGRLSP